MVRKRGRPPEPFPIGGYDKPNDEESPPIPVHQLLEASRQLPLSSVRESESDIVMQPEQDMGSNLRTQPLVSQRVDNISNSQERRLAINPLQNPLSGWLVQYSPTQVMCFPPSSAHHLCL